MQYGISGAPIPKTLPYALVIQQAAEEANVPPLLAYAIACRESIIGEMNGKWEASTVESFDGGHGLFQLTSSWPDDWEDPLANARWACTNYIGPAIKEWTSTAYIPNPSGDDLIRCVAATFNAGFGGAWRGHKVGNVDAFTTNNYGAGVLTIYHNLMQKGTP